jgi:nucleoside-diphosphate-sugar epimerase
MNILVFGGNRFTGKLIVEKLYSEGHIITVINRKGNAPVNCSIIKCDRNDEQKLELLLSGKNFDCVIDMCLFNIQQAKISVKIFNNQIKKYIYISSVAVYKKSFDFPIDENYPKGLWPMFGEYGTDKREVEEYFESIKNFPFINLRPTYIIGKGNHLNREGYYFNSILNNQIIDIEGNGDAIISFVFVEDLTEIICKIAIKKAKLRESYNVCNDEFITIKDFIILISDLLNKKPLFKKVNKLVTFKNENCYFENQKIKKEYNHNFKSLESGLAELSEYYLDKSNF